MSAEKKTVLVTGGTGFIGSHIIVELLNADYQVITIDNLVNSRSGSLRRVEEITGKSFIYYKCDLLDAESLNKVFAKHKIDYVIHTAAQKAVGESMQFPFKYYKTNVSGTINLIETMKAHKVFKMISSSSSTVYGDPEFVPVTEDHPTGNVANVYGRSKYIVEQLLQDISRADEDWNFISLRYFNPVGAHPSGRLGEDPTKPFITNLMPIVGQIAMGQRPALKVMGQDYNTVDGTAVRDYIHVKDVAFGHLAVLRKLDSTHLRYKPYNFGRGEGRSVLEFVAGFEAHTNTKVPLEKEGRRLGDAETVVCDSSLARKELEFNPTRDFKDMCVDFMRWMTMNPKGYQNDEPYPPATL